MSDFTQKILLAVLGGFLAASGGIVVALWSDSLTRKRERRAGASSRRRALVAFMIGWRHEIGRLYMHEGGGGFEHKESSFKDNISLFLSESAALNADLRPAQRIQFEALCAAIIGWKHQSIYGKELNEAAQKKMTDLIDFLNQLDF